MKLLDLLQMTQNNRQPQQQSEGLGPIMQFLSQNHVPQMAPIRMPDLPDYGAQIMAHGMQKQDQEDQYAAHLQAKADMEAQQAAAIKGHEHEVTQDPQLRAMLTSGNPQLVAYAMKLAEDEKQQQIKSQYNENPTYQKWLNATPQERAQLEQYLKLKTPATNIYTDSVKPPVGYRWNGDDHTSVLPLIGGPEDRAAQPLTESQAKAMSNLRIMEETSKQYDEFIARTKFDPTKMSMQDSLAQGLMSIDSPLADAFGLTPSIEHHGRQMASPEALEYFTTIGRWNEIFGRDKSGGAIKNPEYRAWLTQYWPGPNDSPEIVANKTKARKAYEQSLMQIANPEYRQRATTGNSLVNKALDVEGVPDGHPLRALANTIASQESGGNANVHDSVDGAKGLMQVMPGTFNQMMPEGNIRDPLHNAIAGVRYLKQGWQETNGDPWGTAMFYHGGPGAKPNTKDGLGVSNARYARDVTAKLQSGSNSDVAKNRLDYKEARRQATQTNSPANKEKKARLEAMLKEAEQY